MTAPARRRASSRVQPSVMNLQKLLAAARQTALAALVVIPAFAAAQQPTQPEPQQAKPAHQGQVIFQSGPPATARPEDKPPAKAPQQNATPDIDDAVRSAVTVTAYDLDLRLQPADSRIAARAHLTLRNDGHSPLAHVALQVSSALQWESITLVDGATRTRLPLAQHTLETDADHTGKSSEAVLALPTPLAPGASLQLDAFYSGAITPSSERLQRIGATAATARQTDWDAIGEESTSLRGFGNVLWYPISWPQIFLGQGAQLFNAVGQMKLRLSASRVRLRLTVEYAGPPPIAAYFCGRRAPLKPLSENAAAAAATAPGLATASFPEQPIGFRNLSLFLVPLRETPADPQPEGWSLLSVETESEAPLSVVAASAQDAAAVLTEWLGPQPLSALTLIDHPGQPFEDGPLLVAPLSSLAAAEAAPAIMHSLTHAWLQTGQPWMDEGLAEYFVLLWTERTRGRASAIEQLAALEQPLALGEVAPEANKPAPPGQPLLAATSEIYYRRKSAAVWWMLRDIAGDQPLRLALTAWRTQPPQQKSPAEQAAAFEALLQKTSGKDLHWFFDDWVLHDRGLPDLNLVDVTPRELPTSAGKSGGWLTSVTLRNDGAAAVEVPVVVRSGSFSETQRLRVPGFGSATARVLVESPPTEILVNDGSVPEQRASIHHRDINVHTQIPR